jgi:hypothetical protein
MPPPEHLRLPAIYACPSCGSKDDMRELGFIWKAQPMIDPQLDGSAADYSSFDYDEHFVTGVTCRNCDWELYPPLADAAEVVLRAAFGELVTMLHNACPVGPLLASGEFWPQTAVGRVLRADLEPQDTSHA